MKTKTTDTPRTDENAVSHIGFYTCATVPADFARELERELEQAKRDNGIIITAFALRNSELKEKAEAEVARLREENAELKQGKVFVDPKWIYDLETQLAKAHEELCQAGIREYGN